jgi:hypothetical protein
MALKLVNGKFFDGDKEVPLEFGNWQQIRLLQAELKRQEELDLAETEGILTEAYCNDVRTIFEISVDHQCTCKQTVWFSDEIEGCDDEDEAVEHYTKSISSIKTTCKKCGTKWELRNVKDELRIFKV